MGTIIRKKVVIYCAAIALFAIFATGICFLKINDKVVAADSYSDVELQITGGDFKDVSMNSLDGWYYRFSKNTAGSNYYYSRDRLVEIVHDEEDGNVLHLSKYDQPISVADEFTLVGGPIPVEIGAEYTLSFRFRTVGTPRFYGYIGEDGAGADGASGWVNIWDVWNFENTEYPAWENVTRTVTATRNTWFLMISVFSEGEIYVDDIVLTKSDGSGSADFNGTFDGDYTPSVPGWTLDGEVAALTHAERQEERKIGFYGQGSLTSDVFSVDGSVYDKLIADYDVSEDSDIILKLQVNDGSEFVTAEEGTNNVFILPDDTKEVRLIFEGTCGSVDNISAKAHSCDYSGELLTKAPTCTEGGYTYHECLHGCGTPKIEETLQATGHDFDSASWETVAPTCTDGGYEVRRCANGCGEEERRNEVPASGHSYGELVTEKEPTCTENGLGFRTCAACGDVQYETIEAEGHRFEEEIIKSETCADDGEAKYTCTDCGFVYTDIIPATGDHKYENGVCAVCGEEDPNGNTGKGCKGAISPVSLSAAVLAAVCVWGIFAARRKNKRG